MKGTQNQSAAKPQVQVQEHPVTIKELYRERQKYENYPVYQRRKVWPLKYKRGLINTILNGRTIQSLIAYKEMDDQGVQTYWINDGQQRLSTILDFIDGKFRTWTNTEKQHAEPNSPAPVEPGKFFKDMNVYAKNILWDYVIRISVEPKSEDSVAREGFRSSQHHIPLSPAERIATYDSKASEVAQIIENHVFWSDFYMGKRATHRKNILLAGFQVIGLELSPNETADLQATNYIDNIAAGKIDDQITNEVIKKIMCRLDKMCCIFSGSTFTIRATALIMYQAVQLLEREGVTINLQTDRGKLTSWINAVMVENNKTVGVPGWNREIQTLVRKKNQLLFWEKHRRTVLGAFGLKDAIVQI